jgi:hypothetical protein
MPLLFGSAESTAADFSHTSLKISFVSQMVLIPLHAVDKCGIASGRPAFYGQTLSRTVPAYSTGPPCRKRHKFWRQQYIGISLKFTDFRQTIAAYLLTGVQSKKVKTKSDHHHCPISVYTLMTSKIEAVIEIHRWGLWLLKWGVGGRYSTGETPPIKAERPEPSDHLRSTCTRVNTIYEDLNKSSSARLWGSQQLESLPSPNSNMAQNFSAWVLIGAEILEARQFCWRSNFTRRGDFNVRLSSIVCYQVHEFCMSAEVFRRSFLQKFSAKVFRRSFLQKFSAEVFRRSFPQQFSAEAFRSKFPSKFSAWILRQPPQFSWDAEISCICNILSGCWYFMIMLDFELQIFVYIFSIYLCIVYAPIFLGNCFNLRFKIDILVMNIWGIVIIINFVLTL